MPPKKSKKPAAQSPMLPSGEGAARQSITRDQLSDAERRRLAELEKPRAPRRRTK